MDATCQQSWPKYRNERVSLFLRLFAAVSVVFCLLWQASLYVDALLDNRREQAAMEEATRYANDLLAGQLQTFAADLKILAAGFATRRLASGDAAARAEVESVFKVFVEAKQNTAQLRYLDRSGQEVVRIDRRGDVVQAVTGTALQNKADRYYFTESIGLPEGRIYVSRIDLNVEQGKVEVPWRPMLRLATPLHDDTGAAAGIVIVNIKLADFLVTMQRLRPLGSAPLQLVNAEGYWLAGVGPDRLFGFMFDREVTLAAAAPQAWQAIRAARRGRVDDGGTHYFFETLDPAPLLRAEVALPGGVTEADDAGTELAWKVVGVVSAPSLAAAWRVERLPVALAGLALLAGLVWAWSGTITARRASDRERRLAETELVRAERLSSLGSLVAGVAHELNTPIGNAVGVASTLSEATAELDEGLATGRIGRSKLESLTARLRDGTGMMQRDLQRAAQLIGNFKQVAVDQASERRRRFRLDDLVADVVGSLRHQFTNSPLELETRLKPTPEIDGYAGPLTQVLMNLVSNARLHGFDDGQAGRITVATRTLAGGEVELVVADSGKGIAPAMRERIFEPFFSTRLGEGGSGLGLSIVFNIVTNVLGGTIRAESRPGRGTRMILRFPVTAPSSAQPNLGSIFDA